MREIIIIMFFVCVVYRGYIEDEKRYIIRLVFFCECIEVYRDEERLLVLCCFFCEMYRGNRMSERDYYIMFFVV